MELAASILKLFERQKINKFEKQRVVYKNNRFVALPSCSRALPLHGAPMKPHNVIQKAPKKKAVKAFPKMLATVLTHIAV